MSGIEWEDPPPSGRGRYVRRSRWDGVLARLREEPGRWGRIATLDRQGSAAHLANRIRKGKIPAARPAGSFEATSRGGRGDTEFAVYARYVGDQTITDPSAACQRAGEGSGPAGPDGRTGRSAPGAPGGDAAGGSRHPGAPTRALPDPQPGSPRDAGPESGRQAAPSARSLAEGAEGAPPCAGPVAQGGDTGQAVTP